MLQHVADVPGVRMFNWTSPPDSSRINQKAHLFGFQSVSLLSPNLWVKDDGDSRLGLEYCQEILPLNIFR